MCCRPLRLRTALYKVPALRKSEQFLQFFGSSTTFSLLMRQESQIMRFKGVLCLCLMPLLSVSVAWDQYGSTQRKVCQGWQCPHHCRCYLDRVNCSGIALSAVPDILPQNTSTLLLSNNNISTLAPGSFWACEKLQTLDLSNNSFQPDDFSDAIFSGLGSLKTLHIHNNKLARHYHGKFLVKGCPNVETLSMDGLQHSAFGEEFGHLKSLLNLKLYGNLADITNNTFKAFNGSLVTTLIIRSGQLASVQPLSFAHFHYLETLDLSFNPQLGLQNAAKSWYGLQYTNISSLILECVSHNETNLEPTFDNNLNLTSLKNLVIDWNNILSLSPSFYEYTPDLEHLSFAYNKIRIDYTIMDNLGKLENLRYLDGSFQTPALAQNQPPPSWRSQPSSGNQPLHLPPNLEVINVTSSMAEQWPTGYLFLINGKAMRHIVYAQNGLRRINFTVVPDGKFKNKVVLDLSGNHCEEVDSIFFLNWGDQIGELYLSDNRLGRQLSLDGDIFSNLTELTELDLSKNEIHTLSKNVFDSQEKLEHLKLNDNHLANIKFSLNHMIKLSALDLTNNHLKTIDGNTRQVFANLATLCGHDFVRIDLSDNLLEISCKTLSFLKWTLKSQGVHLDNWAHYTGMYNGKRVTFSSLQDDILPELRAECVGKEVPIVVGILLAISIVALVLTVVLFRYRFEVQYLFLKMIISRKKYQAFEQQQQEADAYFEYDAFVAFDQNDLPFVKEKLQPTLEGDGSFRLCIHQRDFASGPIEENILKALHNSRNTILLLSKHFVNSSWCRYELQMARLRCFDEGRDLIIPIVLDDLPVRKLNRTLRGLLRKNTYIEWPESQNQQDIDNFWLKMRRSLQLQPERVVRCQCGRTMNQTDLV